MRDWNREVVITGMGVVCHLGDELAALERHLRSGTSLPFARWAPAVEHGARCQLIGVYEGDVSDDALGIDKRASRFFGRSSRLALKAARAALATSGLDPREAALIVGSGTGDVETHREVHSKLEATHDAKKVGPTVIPRIMASTVSANLVNVLETRGPSLSVSAACAGGTYNVLLAAQLIEAGFVDAAIAGGVECGDIHFHSGFDAMRAYNGTDNDTPERASRPYAADRAGFIFAEGAGVLVLESLGSARARGATILGTVRGYGMSSDGKGEMVAPDEDGAYRAMCRALAHAEVEADAIDYVNTHGTSTPLGDVSEVRALRRAFGGRHVRYSSTKGYTGHTISAAGAIEAIFTLLMLRGGYVAPSIRANPLDPAVQDFSPVVEPLAVDLQIAASNSFGFGGTNATLVLAREPRG
ncbi:MAG: beta-ketoacyl-[acyl-carrier-protein] synthase family protein [Deltaproteobacteria bacterium]|nr:beta-ketoacyl-[acyl-carrier-protein] synthase family protein [Deltaproteobacteria bacterium]